MSAPANNLTVPGYRSGVWTIDPVHSEVSFVVRHLGISRVRGRFESFEGEIVTGENPLDSSVTATIHTASLSTAKEDRDNHVRSEEFLHVEEFPAMTYRSTGIRRGKKDGLQLDGELTLRGVTRPVSLELEVVGFGEGMTGKPAAGFAANGEIRRSEFGVGPTEGPLGAVVSDTVSLTLNVEANLKE